MARVSTLTFQWQLHPHGNGCQVAEFCIDGVLLRDHCERALKETFSMISPFGWTTQEFQRESAERLLLQRPATLQTGRRELLVCNLCADPGCGCVSALVEVTDEHLHWRELGSEYNYNPDEVRLFPMGDFTFDLKQARAAFAVFM